MKPLSKTRTGDTCTIQWMFGAPEAVEAMRRLDLHEGSSICVMQKLTDGLIIRSSEHRIALGTEAAERIQVG